MLAFGIVMSCSKDDESKPETKVTNKQVIENYANVVYTSYKDSYDEAIKMKTAIDAFVTNPTDATLKTAKNTWFR